MLRNIMTKCTFCTFYNTYRYFKHLHSQQPLKQFPFFKSYVCDLVIPSTLGLFLKNIALSLILESLYVGAWLEEWYNQSSLT